jgi:heme exporter protein A
MGLPQVRLIPVQPLVSLDAVGVSLGGQPVLRGLDLTVSPSDLVGIAGPNGSGKTTLLRLMATLVPPDAGSGRVLGAALGSRDAYRVRPRVGLIGHAPALIPELSLRENLVHAARLAGIELRRVDRALEVVGLARASDRRASAGSHGMQRRTEIALILLRAPELLLLDEPLAGLDESSSALVAGMIARTREAGGAVLMVSHEPSHLAGCDRTIVLGGGAPGAG